MLLVHVDRDIVGVNLLALRASDREGIKVWICNGVRECKVRDAFEICFKRKSNHCVCFYQLVIENLEVWKFITSLRPNKTFFFFFWGGKLSDH